MISDRWKPGGDKYEAMKADEQWEKAHETTKYEIQDCPTCGGNGFSGQGTGYGDVCDDCAGSGEILVDRFE